MKKVKNNDTIKMVLNYIKKYRISVVLSLLFAAVTVVLTLYLPILTGDAVDYMIGKGRVDFEKLAGLIAKMAVIICLTGISQWIMNICNNKITY
ncbi:MAG: ABC transporter ATP-binding protein, partial [Lachnospiraceae bacterium]|nr:ABC transporter ATP-binding protein [Lachnospiraceae bacterium]